MENEKRLIDAEALCFRFVELCRIIDCADDCVFHVDSIIDEIEEAPTVDAVEVVHGRWIHPKGYVVSNGFLCSECGYEETSYHAINPRYGCCIADEHGNFYYPPKKNYCPNCGAKMDGDGNV